MKRALLLLALAGCGSSVTPPSDDAGSPDLAPGSPFCTCGTGKSCLRAVVTRAADAAKLPWVMFAGQGSDGFGTLVVSAQPAGAGAAIRQTADAVDAKPATISLNFDFGCVDLGTWTVRAFLDDNNNAADTDLTSADFHDACMQNRSPTATVKDAQISTAALQLANSCD